MRNKTEKSLSLKKSLFTPLKQRNLHLRTNNHEWTQLCISVLTERFAFYKHWRTEWERNDLVTNKKLAFLNTDPLHEKVANLRHNRKICLMSKRFSDSPVTHWTRQERILVMDESFTFLTLIHWTRKKQILLMTKRFNYWFKHKRNESQSWHKENFKYDK